MTTPPEDDHVPWTDARGEFCAWCSSPEHGAVDWPCAFARLRDRLALAEAKCEYLEARLMWNAGEVDRLTEALEAALVDAGLREDRLRAVVTAAQSVVNEARAVAEGCHACHGHADVWGHKCTECSSLRFVLSRYDRRQARLDETTPTEVP